MCKGNQGLRRIIEKDQNGSLNFKISEKHKKGVKVLQKVRHEDTRRIGGRTVVKTENSLCYKG